MNNNLQFNALLVPPMHAKRNLNHVAHALAQWLSPYQNLKQKQWGLGFITP